MTEKDIGRLDQSRELEDMDSVINAFKPGAPVNNYLPNSRRTILFFVTNIDHANFLIFEKKADVNWRDIGGNTPLHVVRNVDIACSLIYAGANPSIANNAGIKALENPIVLQALDKTFEEYQKWCVANGMPPLSGKSRLSSASKKK